MQNTNRLVICPGEIYNYDLLASTSKVEACRFMGPFQLLVPYYTDKKMIKLILRHFFWTFTSNCQ